MAESSHEGLVPATDQGCLVICDVSGYTEYLHSVELEHAQDVLADLTETVVTHLTPTFRFAKLEGDAVFVYALAAEAEAAMVLDTIEAAYFAFRDRVRDIDHATSCTCAACRLIPMLDLKVVTHFGQFGRQRIAGNEELTGSDVILTHRLLKNSVRERLESGGYALHTDACVEALGIEPETLGLVAHVERYDDIGEVRCHVDDLDARWRYESARRRVFVTPAEAEFEVVDDLPAPPATAWDWITSPEKRPLYEAATKRIDETATGGRRGVGTTNHCVHGRSAIVQRILDWRPFRYFTIENEVPVIGPWVWTIELEETGPRQTRVHMRPARVEGWKGRAMLATMRRKLIKDSHEDFERLRGLLEEETIPTPA